MIRIRVLFVILAAFVLYNHLGGVARGSEVDLFFSTCAVVTLVVNVSKIGRELT